MKLQKAGTGLPTFERNFLRYAIVPFVRIFFTWDLAVIFLKREVKLIENLVKNIEKEKRNISKIITRTLAIEDDSRRNSINQTLEHLVIAGELVKNVIQTLSKEEKYSELVKIENVKAYGNNDEQLKLFLEFYNDYFEFIKKFPKKQSKTKHKHPWFVEFNNFDWSVFMYMHTFIHRRQIEQIIKEIDNE